MEEEKQKAGHLDTCINVRNKDINLFFDPEWSKQGLVRVISDDEPTVNLMIHLGFWVVVGEELGEISILTFVYERHSRKALKDLMGIEACDIFEPKKENNDELLEVLERDGIVFHPWFA